jgi:hypothetical protein
VLFCSNEKAFGRPGASRGASAFPKIRFVALLENGTHVLWAARMSKYATDEITLSLSPSGSGLLSEQYWG